MPLYQLIKEQFIRASLDNLWEFISSPKNLKEITPSYMRFDITSQDFPEKMYAGMIITYKVRPLLGIPMTWITEITHVDDKKYFVDEQRMGPYTFWHHQHHLKAVDGGVMMYDIVSYRPPMFFLGGIANSLIIRKKLEEIFAYRKKALEKRFPVD